jgi:septum formation protein
MPCLILASASPRRRALLESVGLQFIVCPADVPEEDLEEIFTGSSAELASYLANHKAKAIATSSDITTDSVVLAADTTVRLDDQILGKPRDGNEARSMLHRLRGRTHTVTTGIAVMNLATGKIHIDSCHTPVTMRDYSDKEITDYIASGDPFDKAGSYAIQHPTFQPVARISGCATNVIGLPLCVVLPILHDAGFRPQLVNEQGPCKWSDRCTQIS